MASTSAGLQESPAPLVEVYDCAMLDLDGVVYRGQQAIEGVPESLAAARKAGLRLAYVTNNAARPPDEVARTLRDLGIAAEPADVVTSAQAAAREAAKLAPPGAAVLVVGGPGLEQALTDLGLRPVRAADEQPVAVVQGFHPAVDWRQLAEATFAIRSGATWIAANLDRTLPTARGPAPGNGTLVDAVATAIGGPPAVVAGKPFRGLFDETVLRTGCQHPLVVGDRLDTDIEGANRIGADSLLVMTGVTDLAALCRARPEQRPSFVSWTLDGLLGAHPAPEASGEGFRLNGWRAQVTDGRLTIDAQGSDDDAGLRAVAAAAWSAADADHGDTMSDFSVEELAGRFHHRYRGRASEGRQR